jgi:hypothetical protein
VSERFWKEPSQSNDIFDETPNRNPQLVDVKPYSDGKKHIAKHDLKRCLSDGSQYDPKLDKCPKCGCPDSEFIEAKYPVDIIPLGPTAHLRRRLKTCWNQKENSDGEVTKHEYIEEKIPVITVLPVMVGGSPTTGYEIHDEVRCKQCHMPYQRVAGRNATDEEIQRFKDGKIERASKRLAQNWIGQQ